jgi:hypothetical protein
VLVRGWGKPQRMRRFLCSLVVACGLGFGAVATAATPAPTSCRYAAPAHAFPNVLHLAISDSACRTAAHVAASIQGYWRTHSAQPPARALPRHADGFTCAYALRHEPTGDPFYAATCRRAGVRARMDLTS